MSRRRPVLIVVTIFAVVLFSIPAFADDFLGASALVEKLKPDAKPATPAPTSQDDAIHLSKDLKSFAQQSATLPPQEAAGQWLALFDRDMALRGNPAQASLLTNMPQQIFQALPAPESWPDLQKLVEARTPGKQPDPWAHDLLLLVVHTLNNVEDKQWADLAALITLSDNPTTPENFDGPTTVLLLGAKLSTMANLSDEAEKFWDHVLADLVKAPALPASMQPGDTGLEFPDLVTLLGAAKAEPLLLRALLLPNVHFTKFDGNATEALARKLALANIDKLPVAPWSLTQSLDGSDLYVALVKRFPADPNNQEGAIYHVIALFVQGKADEAVKASEKIDPTNLEDAADKAAQAGYGAQVYEFLHALLQAHPEDDAWKLYVNIAAQMSYAPEALKFVQDSLARKDLNDLTRAMIQQVLYRALLAVDKVDEGIAQLQAVIEKAKQRPGADAANNGDLSYATYGYTQYSTISRYVGINAGSAADIAGLDLELARIGHLLKRTDLETEALDDARKRMPKDNLIEFLMQTGRNVEAEKLLIDEITAEAASEKNNPQQAYAYIGGYSPSQSNLIKLAQVYYNAGRWADILTLLDQVPGWGATDLVDIAGEKAYSERYTPPSVGLMAARALSETGRTDDALAVLDYTLRVDAGDDAVYELLLNIGKGDLIAKLDTLFQQDQFQNRPLIWKATLLLQQGKIAEAEQACKTAIAIDPSDGETGKGDRMRVYGVMADVCDAKKDAAQATFFRNVIKAIRMSEDADDYYDAGLLTHAVTMYGKALDLFSDAYCIQSRIARQLAELGRMDEAAIHYRKAFELMPVSFGRMESHCFGCERAFQGKTATAIAEKTFTDMLAKDPKKPQLYYLLGYLYKEEERYPEAVTNFQKAAELDPDYINAWKQIVEIGANYQLKPDLRDEAIFNLLRLDPAGRHTTPTTENVRQLGKLWAVEVAAVKAVPPAPASLLPLTASAAQQAAAVEQWKKSVPNGIGSDMTSFIQEQINIRIGRQHKDDNTPREAVLGNAILSTSQDLFR